MEIDNPEGCVDHIYFYERDVTITDVYDNTNALVGAGGGRGFGSSGFNPGTALRPCPRWVPSQLCSEVKRKVSHRQAIKAMTEEGVTDR